MNSFIKCARYAAELESVPQTPEVRGLILSLRTNIRAMINKQPLRLVVDEDRIKTMIGDGDE